MRVRLCNGCIHKKDRTWSTSYQPANFHLIGMTHRYAYCVFAKKRCLEVKNNECSLKKVRVATSSVAYGDSFPRGEAKRETMKEVST